MTPAELEDALAGSDEYAARDAVRAVAEILRRPTHGDEDRIGLALALSEAAPGHPSVRVREEIAKACDAFPDPFFDAALAVLAADSDAYVREHARRAADRHATKKDRHKRDAQQRELDVALRAVDDAEGRAEGAKVRRLAERAVRRGVEQFMAQLDHELGKVHEAIGESLERLEVEADRDAPSPAALRRDVGDLQNRVGYLFSMLRRSRAYSQRITPRFERTDVAALVGEARAARGAGEGAGGRRVRGRRGAGARDGRGPARDAPGAAEPLSERRRGVRREHGRGGAGAHGPRRGARAEGGERGGGRGDRPGEGDERWGAGVRVHAVQER